MWREFARDYAPLFGSKLDLFIIFMPVVYGMIVRRVYANHNFVKVASGMKINSIEIDF